MSVGLPNVPSGAGPYVGRRNERVSPDDELERESEPEDTLGVEGPLKYAFPPGERGVDESELERRRRSYD